MRVLVVKYPRLRIASIGLTSSIHVIGLAFFLALCGVAVGESPITIETALTLVESHEHQIRVAEWDTRGVGGTVTDVSNAFGIQSSHDPRIYSKSHVIYEPSSNRFRIDTESVLGWTHGTDPFFAGYRSYSYDGHTQRFYQNGNPGTQLPRGNSFKQGAIRFPDVQSFIDSGKAEGIDVFPPNFFGKPFSEFLRARLRQKLPLRVTETDAGTWRFETLLDDHIETGCITQIEYDPRRGIILGAEWKVKFESPHPESRGKPWKRMTISWTELSQGVWVPKFIFTVYLWSKSAGRLDYENVRINFSVDDSVFRLQFPIGTHVVDDVEKKIYTVSSGAINEQAAIREYMRSQELIESFAPRPWYRSTIVQVALIMLALAVVAATVGWWWRRRRAVAMLLILLPCSRAINAANLDQEGNWVVSHAPGERIRISQCGLNVTVFALEYFGVEYDVKLLAAGLPPSQEGICLADIKTMLEAHGLEVIARQNVSISELERVVLPGTIALFPVKINEHLNHYLVAVRTQGRGFLAVDPPRHAGALAESASDESFTALGGVVLFVRRPSKAGSEQATRVDISPESTDLGKLRTNDPELSRPIRIRISIENKSEIPVLVQRVRSPCGCMQVDWAGGCIRSGEKHEMTVTIVANSWGKQGHIERNLTLEFQDGSKREIRFIADVFTPEEIQQLRVFPADLHITPKRERLALGEAMVFLDGIDPERVSASSDSRWLKFNLRVERSGELLLRVTADTELAGELPAEAEILIRSRQDQQPVKLRVILDESDRFELVPRVLRIRSNESKPQMVAIMPKEKSDRLSPGLRTLSAPEGLRVERRDQPDGTTTLAVHFDGIPKNGYYLVRCQLGDANAEPVPIKFVVIVTN